MHSTLSETHLFILWPNGRQKEKEVMEIVKKNFQILKLYEILWSQDKILDNYTSFYGFDHSQNYNIINERGGGHFLLMIVRDNNPKYENRMTSKGMVPVNINTSDVKSYIRNVIFQGINLLHGTNSEEETRHDLALLLGRSLSDFLKETKLDGALEKLSQNLPAVDGWKSLSQVFYILNETCRYAVLRGFEKLPGNFTPFDGDIDLLIEDPQCFTYTLMSAQSDGSNDFAFANLVKVKDSIFSFHAKYIGDGYYDTRMSQKIIDTRQKNKAGIYIPSDEMYFYELLYHGIIHKTNYLKYADIFKTLASELKIEKFNLEFSYLKKLINTWLKNNNYKCPLHLDHTRSRHNENISEKKLIKDIPDIYIYQNHTDTIIFSSLLIARHPGLASRYTKICGPYHNWQQHLLSPEHKLYKEMSRKAAKGQIAWIFKKRFGRIMLTTLTVKSGETIFTRKILGTPQDIESPYLIVTADKKRKFIAGNNVGNILSSIKDSNILKIELEKFVGEVFSQYRTGNAALLQPNAWDAVPHNCILTNENNYCFFDFEYSLKHGVDKSYMLWRIIRHTNMIIQDKFSLYDEFCKKFNLENKFFWCEFLDAKIHERLLDAYSIPPSFINKIKKFLINLTVTPIAQKNLRDKYRKKLERHFLFFNQKLWKRYFIN